LLKYARLQLRNPALAEDLVQETLLAGLEGAARFSGKSTIRTWLTGILKHKIIDQFRRNSRWQPRTMTAAKRTSSTRCSSRTGTGSNVPPAGATRNSPLKISGSGRRSKNVCDDCRNGLHAPSPCGK
jgi:RNA polymerase sigma factor (sigma-70 family)